MNQSLVTNLLGRKVWTVPPDRHSGHSAFEIVAVYLNSDSFLPKAVLVNTTTGFILNTSITDLYLDVPTGEER